MLATPTPTPSPTASGSPGRSRRQHHRLRAARWCRSQAHGRPPRTRGSPFEASSPSRRARSTPGPRSSKTGAAPFCSGSGTRRARCARPAARGRGGAVDQERHGVVARVGRRRGGSEPSDPTARASAAATRRRPSRRSWSSSVARWWHRHELPRAGRSASRWTTGAARSGSCSVASLAADRAPFSAGTWVEVLGVLGQETTGAQPLRGYRVWPRSPGDVRILAAATGTASADASPSGGGDAASGGGSADRVACCGRWSRPGRPASRGDVGGVGMARAGGRRPPLGWIAARRHRARVGGTGQAGHRSGARCPSSLELGGLRQLGMERWRRRARHAGRQPRRHRGRLRPCGASFADRSGAR